MSDSDTALLAATAPSPLAAMQASLKKLERRDWWLWGASILVMLLLVGVVAALSLPTLITGEEITFQFQRSLAVRGLLALILLFSVYVIYQQYMIHRLRRQVAEQIALGVRVEERAEAFEKEAVTDPLTGLYNRRFVERQLESEVARSHRHGYSLAVLALDLNNLKQINDDYGHAAGDLALQGFAGRLKKAIRNADIPARVGGDEFAVVLPECRSDEVPRVLARMGDLAVEFEGQRIALSFSAGWAEYRRGESPERFLRRADQALYADKRNGKAEREVHLAAAQLEQSKQMEAVGRLARGMADQFCQLFKTVQEYSELLRGELQEDDPRRGKVDDIQKTIKQATSLASQLRPPTQPSAAPPVGSSTEIPEKGSGH